MKPRFERLRNSSRRIYNPVRMKTVVLLLSLGLAVAAPAAPSEEVAALLKKGDALDKQLKTSEALAVYLEADKADPNDAEILHRIAREYGLSMDDVGDDASKRE